MARSVNRLPLQPMERALKAISGRWKGVILYHLLDGPKRLSNLKRLVPDISQKVLVQQLRELEEHGLVHREVFAQVPSRVDYSATPLGLSLENFDAIGQWRTMDAGTPVNASGVSDRKIAIDSS